MNTFYGLLAGAAPQDSAAALLGAAAQARDSVIVESPLPGGVAEVVRFIFNVPQWIQIGGFFLGVAVALAVLATVVRRRAAIATWLRTRQRAAQLGLAGGLFGAILLASGAGMASWNYMQHDNGFCTGCHVMDAPFGEFQARASKHDSLECHDCHQQPITASLRQLYLWVAERPQEIGEHAPLENGVCARCHVTDGAETWERIVATAGHRTHLESDSTDLEDLRCVTCHGEEVHRFVPVDRTCGQSGCHDQDKTKISLGGMARQTSLHCVTCHQFTADVPALATRDSAEGTLRPGNPQCLGCHEMQNVLADFDPELDPHNGTCGMCHNPHDQETPAAAATTCAGAGCHDNWRNEPFHQGLAHRRVGDQCVSCHAPHKARVDPSDCNGCHANLRRASGGRLRLPPPPFDTLRALRRSNLAPPPAAEAPDPRVFGVGMPWLAAPAPVPRPAVAPPDTFSHPRHRQLNCLTCHVSTQQHGRLTFEPPRGCQICHHEAPRTSTCATCHVADELVGAVAAILTVHVVDRRPRAREVGFGHPAHQSIACITCHNRPVTLTADSASATCAACHDDHHTARADCAACHTGADWAPSHERPADAHRNCDACHREATVARLVPTRPFCSTCHAFAEPHYPAKQCTVCHFLETPAAYQNRLRRGAPPS